MKSTKKDLPKSQIELTITITQEEYEPHLKKAAEKISQKIKIKGFRKGHVPYDIVEKEAGEMAILQEALETIVQKSYVEAIKEHKLEVMGSPQIAVEKVAPKNDVVYKATVALLPEVTLADPKKISVKKEVKKITKKDADETLDALRGMQAEEIIKDGAAEGTDKLVLDMEMTQDNVVVEGGSSKDYQVYLSEDHYIPGFNEEVAGLKKGDEKKFNLTFPKKHYQKQLAGKTIDFAVKVKGVYERKLPELNEDFAKKLGQDSVEKLVALVAENMQKEEEKKAEQKREIAILDALIEKSTFADLPEVLIDSEKEKIFHELQRDLQKNGVSIDQYLQDIKKTEDDLRKGFAEQAEKRAKAALISRLVAKENNIAISEEDITKEIELMKKSYEHNKEAQENLTRPEVRDSIAIMIQNKRVMEFLKGQTKEDQKEDKKKESTKESK